LHVNAGHLCRGVFLCRGLIFLFACVASLPCVWRCLCREYFFAVRFVSCLPCLYSLPCVSVWSHGNAFFAVRRRTAESVCTAAPLFPVVDLP
jgi:hypothetical protein